MVIGAGAAGIVRWSGAWLIAGLTHGALLVGAPNLWSPAPPRSQPALVWLDLEPDKPSPALIEPAARAAVSAASQPPRPRSPQPVPRGPRRVPRLGTDQSAGPAAPAEPDADAIAAAPASSTERTEVAGSEEHGDASAAVGGQGAGATGSAVGAEAETSATAVQPPGLVGWGDPCRGIYPSSAQADHGEVQVLVRVGPDGNTRGCSVVNEAPLRQGFASAARACVERLRFRPARSVGGAAVPGQAVLALRFDRS